MTRHIVDPKDQVETGLTGCLCNGWPVGTCADNPVRGDVYFSYDDRPACVGLESFDVTLAQREWAMRLGVEEDKLDEALGDNQVMWDQYMERVLSIRGQRELSAPKCRVWP
jgi:hypothetical protein